jgi:hypothetical protein
MAALSKMKILKYKTWLGKLIERVQLPNRGIDVYIAAIVHGAIRFKDLKELRSIRRELTRVMDEQIVDQSDGEQEVYCTTQADELQIPTYTESLDDLFELLEDHYGSSLAFHKFTNSLQKISMMRDACPNFVIRDSICGMLQQNSDLKAYN